MVGKTQVRVETLGGTDWDIATNGRIAVVTAVDAPQAQSAEHTVVFMLNFFDYVRQHVPGSEIGCRSPKAKNLRRLRNSGAIGAGLRGKFEELRQRGPTH